MWPAFLETRQNGSGNQTYDDSGIPPANPAANPTADANRTMEDSMQAQENQKDLAALNLQPRKDMASEKDVLQRSQFENGSKRSGDALGGRVARGGAD
jgi:hypothetical protein